MAERRSGMLTRRRALKGMGAAGLALVALPAGSVVHAGRKRGRRRGRGRGRGRNLGWRVSVFRLKTRDTRSCRACREHHRFTIAISRHHANITRAHPGCNCPIVRQRLLKEDFTRLFLDTGAIRRGVVDLRQLGAGE
jgi:hypothetical protein